MIQAFLKGGIKRNSAILCLIGINFLFTLKYLSRITEFAWLIALGSSLFYGVLLLNILRFNFSKRIYQRLQLVLILVFVLGASLVFTKVAIESLNVDRWSVISAFWEALFDGKYPYFARSHMGSVPGPMPFYYVLALPFYLVGELGYFSLFGLFIMCYLFSTVQISQNYKFLLLIFLMSSPFFLWEIIVRSNIFTTSVIIVLLLFRFLQRKNNTNSALYIYALIAGLLLSTRAIFSIPYIIFFMYVLRKKETTFLEMSKFMGVAVFAFGLTFLPLLIQFPNEFFEMNPFIVQSTFLVPFHYSVGFIALAFSCSFLAKSKNDLFYWSGLCLFLVIFIFIVFNLSIEGLREFYIGKKADISYFIFCVPFFILYLLITNNLKTPRLE